MRGLCAATVAAVLVTLIILRQTGHSLLQMVALPPGSSWKRRLQKAHLRTKIAVPMIALAILPSATVGFLAISQMRKSLRETAIKRVEFDIMSRSKAVQGFVQSVQQDLQFLGQMEEVRALISAESSGTDVAREAARQRLQNKLLVFSQGKRAYYQVRYINHSGRFARWIAS